MRVGLVFARDNFLREMEGISNEHIGLGYLANALYRNGYEYRIIDAHFWNYGSKEVIEQLIESKCDVIGFSILYSNFIESMDIISQIKELKPDTLIFMGGHHVSFCAEEILEENDNVDVIIKGEGEETIVELLACYSQGNDLKNIAGITYRNSAGVIVDNQWRRPLSKIEDYGEIRRDVLEMGLRAGALCSLNLVAGRGCLFKCSFCTGNKMFDPYSECGWRVKSAEKVVLELSELIEKYGEYDNLYEIVNFCDLNFINESKEGIIWLKDFVRELKNKQLDVWFYIMTRVDSIVRNKDIVERLRECGLVQIEMGLESGTESGLEVLNKRISTNQSVKAVRYLRERHIDFGMSGFIMYQPYATVEELKTNAEFLKEIDYWKINFLFTKMALYPGTNITENLRKTKNLYDSYCHYNVYDWKFFDSRIEKMYNALSNGLEYKILSEISDTHTNFELVMTLTYRRIEKLTSNYQLLEKVYEAEKNVRTVIGKAKNIIYSYFCEILENVENGWDDTQFELVSNQFMAEYILQNDNVNASFCEYKVLIEEVIRFI